MLNQSNPFSQIEVAWSNGVVTAVSDYRNDVMNKDRSFDLL